MGDGNLNVGRGLGKELEDDIAFLNLVLTTFIQHGVVQEQYLNTTEAALKTMPLSECEKLAPEARKALDFVQKHLPRLRENYDWCDLVGVDFSGKLGGVVRGDFDEAAVDSLREFRDDMVLTHEGLTAGIVELTQPRVLSPPEFIEIVIDSFPEDARSLRNYFRDPRKFLMEVGAHTEPTTYWQGVAAWANLFAFTSLFLGVLSKWIQYGLDEWQDARDKGRKTARKPLQRIERVRAWLLANQPFVSLAGPLDLLLRVLRLSAPMTPGSTSKVTSLIDSLRLLRS